MSKINQPSAAVILILLLMGGPVASQGDPWETLRHKTAWIPIGVLSGEKDPQWITERTYRVLPGRPGSNLLPRIGDVIEVIKLGPIRLHLLDFADKGEERRMESPGSAGRLVTQEDLVGSTLPVGTTLLVQEVHIQKLSTGHRLVWLRVSPPK
jgi:hypothetical protein